MFERVNVRQLILSLAAVCLVVPFLSLAASLVPCGGPGESACEYCHLMELVSNVVNWLVGILTIIATILFMWAGFRLVTSVGGVEAKTAARKTISNTFVGFVIVLAGWIIIDFVMKSLIVGSFSTSFGPWDDFQCVVQPTVSFLDLNERYDAIYNEALMTENAAADYVLELSELPKLIVVDNSIARIDHVFTT